jgi:4-amino-4-deoxy-L-arabinose transferase-like glycosyltransferase
MKLSVLLTAALLLMAAAYFSPHIWRHDEAREALVIQDIVKNHEWLLPLRNNELPSKPVLYHWIGAALAIPLGLSDFTVRSPSIIAAVAMVGITYRLGTLTGDRRIALLAVAILGTTYEFWDSGTEARVDMLFAALLGSALTAWYLWYRSGAELARAAVYLTAAGAVLAKGPAGVALPMLVVGSFVLAERNLRGLLKFFSWRWLAVAVAVDLGWYLTAYHLGGDAFWHKQIIFENVERFLGSGEFHSHRNVLSQARWLITQLFPWSLVLPWAMLRRLRGEPLDSFNRFLHAWWLGIFLFFFLASGRRAVYLLPIYPAVALLAAQECVALWRSSGALWLPSGIGCNWKVAAVVLFAVDIALAAAVPISREVQEDSTRQEEFVENVVAALPADAQVRAAANFPGTALLVLAYRLNRNIERRPVDCQSQAYYLGTGELVRCPAGAAPIVASSSDHSLNLLRLPATITSPRSQGISRH